MMTPRLSLIVPFDDERIWTLLRSFENARDVGKTELILLADGVPPLLLKRIRAELPNKWGRILAMPKTGRIGRLRNRGIAMARAPVCYFVDSDCALRPTTLQEAVRASEKFMIARGPIEFHGYGSLAKLDARLRHHRYEANQTFAYCPNLLVRKEVFEQIGRFDESYFYGSDGEFAKRIMDRGIPVEFVPSLRIKHDCSKSVITTLRTWIRYGEGRYFRYLHAPVAERLSSLYQPNIFALKEDLFYNATCALCLFCRWLGMVKAALRRMISGLHRPMPAVTDSRFKR